MKADEYEYEFSGAIEYILEKSAQLKDDMLPAKIIEYDRVKNRAKVQPLIMQVLEDKTIIKRPILMSIPVLQYGGSGFVLSFDLKAGDIGWIKANDRDISKFLSTYNNNTPNTDRIKNFSDGVFIPDVMHGYNINAGDTATLQSLDGSIKLALNNTSITMQVKSTKIVMTDTEVAITSAKLTHNGINVGNTHVHPQGADSAGNAEQDTGYPQ